MPSGNTDKSLPHGITRSQWVQSFLHSVSFNLNWVTSWSQLSCQQHQWWRSWYYDNSYIITILCYVHEMLVMIRLESWSCGIVVCTLLWVWNSKELALIVIFMYMLSVKTENYIIMIMAISFGEKQKYAVLRINNIWLFIKKLTSFPVALLYLYICWFCPFILIIILYLS